MKTNLLRTWAFILMGSVTWVAGIQPCAEAALVPTPAFQSQDTDARKQDLATIQTALESKLVRAKLQSLGFSDAEVQSRIHRLSDAQIHQLASQIRAVHPAGEWFIGLLIAILLVVLIIYLIKRI